VTRSRNGRPSIGGRPFRVCLFFSANPRRQLTASQISDLFDVPPELVRTMLEAVVREGFLVKYEREVAICGTRLEARYGAGPGILEAIGLQPPEVVEVDDDAPIVKNWRPAGSWKSEDRVPATWIVS
jgi:hypothetical protein